MKLFNVMFCIMLCLGLCVINPVFCQDDTQGYRIGPGDSIEISVVSHDDLHTIATVAPDGTISFPLIGSISVNNKTLPEINATIESALKDDYIKYPQVSTLLKDSKSKRFFIYGEVNSPGAYQMTDDMTVLKAVTLAGGLTKFGSENNVKILRNTNDNKAYNTIKVNLKTITQKGNKNNDVTINANDIIIVSE